MIAWPWLAALCDNECGPLERFPFFRTPALGSDRRKPEEVSGFAFGGMVVDGERNLRQFSLFPAR